MEKTRKALLTLMIAAGMILSACTTRSQSTDLQGSSWKLVSYGSIQDQIAAAAGVDTHLDFGMDGRVTGNMGCNSFSGKYEVKNGRIIISQVISTMMACPGPRMDQETVTLQVLRDSAGFQVENDRLLIRSGDGTRSITLSR